MQAVLVNSIDRNGLIPSVCPCNDAYSPNGMKAFRVPGETSDRYRSIPVIYAVSSAESRDLHMFGETNFFFFIDGDIFKLDCHTYATRLGVIDAKS